MMQPPTTSTRLRLYFAVKGAAFTAPASHHLNFFHLELNETRRVNDRPQEPVLVGRTEVVRRQHTVTWTSSIEVDFRFETRQDFQLVLIAEPDVKGARFAVASF